jgi:hypothetical protein
VLEAFAAKRAPSEAKKSGAVQPVQPVQSTLPAQPTSKTWLWEQDAAVAASVDALVEKLYLERDHVLEELAVLPAPRACTSLLRRLPWLRRDCDDTLQKEDVAGTGQCSAEAMTRCLQSLKSAVLVSRGLALPCACLCWPVLIDHCPPAHSFTSLVFALMCAADEARHRPWSQSLRDLRE